MAKGGKGSACPICSKQTYRDKGSYRECSTCSCVGWGWNQPVEKVGKGKGNLCPNCSNQTLHKILTKGGIDIRRCAKCDYSVVVFPG